ncbi:DUF2909 domain-containing protein [Pseudoalteromonas rubra]|uniref:DUF2909 domain-containing protein n=1 Tax=Pseudoalteromonas rubra TaxID=43658 RepID=A0A4Q7E2X0_9GAMM|nr:DUF2909 domain-containing protein [Pseudoalteromonas rubra]RZM75571.1 DUF2909 domain-containing protein [Pseudoalteromonas rubra]
MLLKLIIIVLLFSIIYNLFRALFIMLKGTQSGESMSRLLGKRVFFSASVLLLILIAKGLGWLNFNPAPGATTHKQTQTSTARPHQQNASTRHLPEMQNGYVR